MLLNFKMLRNIFISSLLAVFLISCGQPDQDWSSYGMDLSNHMTLTLTGNFVVAHQTGV